MTQARIALVVLAVAAAAACGKYGPPLAPEKLAPSVVQELKVSGELQGVSFTWTAPDDDQRGKELKQIDGYRIYRKIIERDSDIEDPAVEIEEVAMIEDVHLQKLEELRKEARAQGKIGRRVDVDPVLKAFRYTDVGAQAGQTYLYQIIPVNQDGVEGEGTPLIRVLFRGLSSTITFIPSAGLGDDLVF